MHHILYLPVKGCEIISVHSWDFWKQEEQAPEEQEVIMHAHGRMRNDLPVTAGEKIMAGERIMARS